MLRAQLAALLAAALPAALLLADEPSAATSAVPAPAQLAPAPADPAKGGVWSPAAPAFSCGPCAAPCFGPERRPLESDHAFDGFIGPITNPV